MNELEKMTSEEIMEIIDKIDDLKSFHTELTYVDLVKKIFEKVPYEEKIEIFKKKNILKMLLEENAIDDFLILFQNGEKLLKLFDFINDSNYNLVSNKSYLNSVEYSKMNFLLNIDLILNNLIKLENIFDINPYIFFTINYKLLYIFDGADLDFFSRYISMNQYIISSRSASVMKLLVERIKKCVVYPEPIIERCFKLIERFSNLENLSIDDIDKLIIYSNIKPDIFEGKTDLLFAIQEYETTLEADCNQVIFDPNSTLDDIKDSILKICFYRDLESSKKLIREYGDSLENMISLYQTGKLEDDSGIKLSMLNFLSSIKHLIQLDDRELLMECYAAILEEINKSENQVNYINSLIVENIVRAAYASELKSNLYIPRAFDRKNDVFYDGKKISVYEPVSDFNLLVSVIGSYIIDDEIIKNPLAAWNNKTKFTNHGICSSLIANDCLSLSMFQDNPLIFGFSNFGDQSIVLASSEDLYSRNTGIVMYSDSESKFRTTRETINNIRRSHSEFVLERRADDKNNVGKRRKPDFVIALNETYDLAKKAASMFDIPIIVLNVKKIASSERGKLDDMYSKMHIEINKDLINEFVLKYNNNFFGLKRFDEERIAYFNPEHFFPIFKSIIDIIRNIDDEERKIDLASCYLNSLENECAKWKDIFWKTRPFDIMVLIDELKSLVDSVNLNERNVNTFN